MRTRVSPSPTLESARPDPADSDIANIVLQKSNKSVLHYAHLPERAIERSQKSTDRTIQRLARLFAAKDELGGALRVLAKAATHAALDGDDDLCLLLIASEAYRRSKELP